MRTLLRNFTHNFRRFFLASLLNLLGLSVAFAAFFIILTQVEHDYNYNKCIPNNERIFRLEIKTDLNNDPGLWICRPAAEALITRSPHIECGSIISGIDGKRDFTVGTATYEEEGLQGFGDFISLFSPEMLSGSTECLKKPMTCLLPESMALKFFGTTEAVGKHFFIGKPEDKKELTVGGVYRDYPKNCQLPNRIYVALFDDENRNNWDNWNYNLYIRLDKAENVASVKKEMIDWFLSVSDPGPEERKRADELLNLVSLDEVHFSKTDNKSASSHGTLYLLLTTGLLVVIVASINFMNFSLAETPMRLRSINTQKVLGATTLSLRGGLVAESVCISLLAFGLSLLWVNLSAQLGMQELVEADLTLGLHPGLLIITGAISLLAGILAGLYPAWYVTSFPPALVLKGSFGLSPAGRSLRTVLIGFQYLVSFTLIIIVSIMYLQNHFIRTSDYGYDRELIIVADADRYANKQKEALRNDLLAVSGVEDVAYSMSVLSSQDFYMTWSRGNGQDSTHVSFACIPVDHHYFNTMGIRLTAGRDFKPSDNNVYIFNESARSRHKHLQVDKEFGGWMVIGFCEDLKFTSFRNVDEDNNLAFIISNWYDRLAYINVRVGKGVDKVSTLKALEAAAQKYSPGHAFNFRFMDKVLDNTYRNELRLTRQILLFSLLTIIISLVGVFSLTMFENEYRRKEIGIRKIMGSTTREILLMFNRHYLYILVVCFVAAVPLSWWLGDKWLEGFAERTPIYWWLFALSFLLVTGITIATVSYQSWKNATENPVKSIKTE